MVKSNVMDAAPQKLPSPPGLISTLLHGFDTVANHIAVIIPPILLDLFLWLGPHLHLKAFFQPIIDRIPSVAGAFPGNFPNASAVQEMWTEAINQFNLFILMRTFPIGTTSLLSFSMPSKTPWGQPVGFDAGSFLGIAGWCLILAVIGWVVGTYYYYSISNITIPSTSSATMSSGLPAFATCSSTGRRSRMFEIFLSCRRMNGSSRTATCLSGLLMKYGEM